MLWNSCKILSLRELRSVVVYIDQYNGYLGEGRGGERGGGGREGGRERGREREGGREGEKEGERKRERKGGVLVSVTVCGLGGQEIKSLDLSHLWVLFYGFFSGRTFTQGKHAGNLRSW